MKKLIIIILILFGLSLDTITEAADSARFDWSQGRPKVMDNPTSTCNNQATIRYSWSMGQPTPVFDATATCTSSTFVAGNNVVKLQNSMIKIINGQVKIIGR